MNHVSPTEAGCCRHPVVSDSQTHRLSCSSRLFLHASQRHPDNCLPYSLYAGYNNFGLISKRVLYLTGLFDKVIGIDLHTWVLWRILQLIPESAADRLYADRLCSRRKQQHAIDDSLLVNIHVIHTLWRPLLMKITSYRTRPHPCRLWMHRNRFETHDASPRTPDEFLTRLFVWLLCCSGGMQVQPYELLQGARWRNWNPIQFL